MQHTDLFGRAKTRQRRHRSDHNPITEEAGQELIRILALVPFF